MYVGVCRCVIEKDKDNGKDVVREKDRERKGGKEGGTGRIRESKKMI